MNDVVSPLVAFEYEHYSQIEYFVFPNAEPIYRSPHGWELHLHHRTQMQAGIAFFSFQLKVHFPTAPGVQPWHVDIEDTRDALVAQWMDPSVTCAFATHRDQLKIRSVHQLAALHRAAVILRDVSSQDYFRGHLEWWLLNNEPNHIVAWACASAYNVREIKQALLAAYMEDRNVHPDTFDYWEVRAMRYEAFREIPYKDHYGVEPRPAKPVGRRGRSETAVDPRLFRVDTEQKHSDDKTGLGMVVPVVSPAIESRAHRPTMNMHPLRHATLEGEDVPVPVVAEPCHSAKRKLSDTDECDMSAKKQRCMPLMLITPYSESTASFDMLLGGEETASRMAE